VKTHELAFASLQQQGLFSSWRETGNGVVPGEGAAFLVLETEEDALARGAHLYGRVSAFRLCPRSNGEETAQSRAGVLNRLKVREAETLVSSANGDDGRDRQEISILEAAGVSIEAVICPKKYVGDLFAAAALLQVALGAALTGTGVTTVLAHCFGHGSTQAAFVLEKA
jgi:3-oxoacyl-(acyl-carrier-protein) synthase